MPRIRISIECYERKMIVYIAEASWLACHEICQCFLCIISLGI